MTIGTKVPTTSRDYVAILREAQDRFTQAGQPFKQPFKAGDIATRRSDSPYWAINSDTTYCVGKPALVVEVGDWGCGPGGTTWDLRLLIYAEASVFTVLAASVFFEPYIAEGADL
jgi:hypothetical protein